MKIHMEGKYSPQQYASRSFSIEVAPEDLGLEQPTNEEQFKVVLDQLMYRARHALEMFYVKDGLHDKDEAVEALRVYKP
jgi:hypothetical protein